MHEAPCCAASKLNGRPPAPRDERSLPLHGVCVVDLVSGPMATVARFLGELGAHVIRIEPQIRANRSTEGVTPDQAEIAWLIRNRGKRIVELDLNDAADRQNFRALVSDADILIESSAPGSAEASWIDVDALLRRDPGLLVLSVTDFGHVSPCRDWRGSDPVFHALSGQLAMSGPAGVPPLLPPAALSYSCAGAQAAFVLLLAYFNRLRSGVGDQLDFSILDGAALALDPAYGTSGIAADSAVAPAQRCDVQFRYPVLPCADGFVRLCILSVRQWQGMLDWMGRPDELADPALDRLEARFRSDTMLPAIRRFFAAQSRAQLEEGAQRHGVPLSAILELDEVIASEQLRARALLSDLALEVGSEIRVPDGIMEIDGHRMRAPEAPPAPCPPRGIRADARATASAATPPLSGLRVLDLGVIVVGAEQGRLLADQGADVIKVETMLYPDGSRQLAARDMVSPSFAAGHRNKRGLGLNLRHPEGRELFLRLVAGADVILSNFKAGVLDALDLGSQVLRAANPRIVLLDSCAFGAAGPWSRRLGYGPLVRAAAGLAAAWRRPGDPAYFGDAATTYPDHVAARVGAAGVLALLIRRERTGMGGAISIGQMDVMLDHLALDVAALALGRQDRPIVQERDAHAPWGIYRCIGEDEWCVVTVRDTDEWRALCSAIGRPDLAADPALASPAGRACARERIDAATAAWLAPRRADEAMETLQRVGVPAARMLRAGELASFAHYAARRLFRPEQDPRLNLAATMRENAPVRSNVLPDPPFVPAPLQGEHTLQIMAELGLCDDEVARLVEVGALELPWKG